VLSLGKIDTDGEDDDDHDDYHLLLVNRDKVSHSFFPQFLVFFPLDAELEPTTFLSPE
jgi:hypothetical protein